MLFPPPPHTHTYTHQLVLPSEARRAEVLIEGVHLEAREGPQVVLRPLPRIAKHVVEALLRGRQLSDGALAAVGQLEVEAKPGGLRKGRERKGRGTIMQ